MMQQTTWTPTSIPAQRTVHIDAAWHKPCPGTKQWSGLCSHVQPVGAVLVCCRASCSCCWRCFSGLWGILLRVVGNLAAAVLYRQGVLLGRGGEGAGNLECFPSLREAQSQQGAVACAVDYPSDL
jgi:hypothetical protein